MRWQSNGNGNLWVRGQFDTIRAINFASLMGTNAQAGTTIRIRLGMSQEQVDGLAAYDSGIQPLISPAVTRSDGVYHSHLEIPSVQSVFWWRIDIGGHVGDFSASALIFGEKREPEHFYNRDREIGFQDLGGLEVARNGVVAETPGVLLRTLLFRLQWVSDDEYKRVWSPMMEVKGKRQVTYWCFDPQADENRQDMTFLGFMVRDMFKRGNDFPRANQMDFQFQALDFRTGPALPLPISAPAPEPSLVLDFATLETVFVRGPGDAQLRPRAFSPFITFTRPSAATRINAAGQIESVAAGVPRLGFDPVTLQPRGLLIEGQRTNLLLRSAEFDNASWGKSGAGTGSAPVVTPNVAVAPDGTMSVDRVDFNRGAGNALADRSTLVLSSITVVSATSYVGSFWVAAATPSDVGKQIGFRHVGNNQYQVITLTAELQRVSTVETSATTGAIFEISSRGTVTTSNQVSILIWGAQLEAGAFASSYIPTQASQVTRTADSATITGANFTDWYRQDEGTLLVDFRFNGIIQDRSAAALFASVQEYITVNLLPAFASNIQSRGISQHNASFSFVPNASQRVAIAYRTNDSAASFNGSTPITDTQVELPIGINRLSIGSIGQSSILTGHIRRIRYWPQRLSNAQLQELTA